MTNRNLEKALDIVSELIMGRAVEKKGDNASLYQEYQNNSEVYDMVQLVLKKMNLIYLNIITDCTLVQEKIIRLLAIQTKN